MLDNKNRYLQIAFNYDTRMVGWLLPRIPHSDRILIEAGTPYIKREGMAGIHYIRRLWRGLIVADIKVTDGPVWNGNCEACLRCINHCPKSQLVFEYTI